MANDNRQCKYCGKELTKRQVWRGCKYCSRKCFTNGYWGEQIEFGKIKTRSKKFLQAIELCQNGMTASQAARLIGVHPHTVLDWFRENGIVLNEKTCQYCGKVFDEKHIKTNRKYCNDSCANKARYAREHPNGRRRPFDPVLRAKALEMYWGGLEGHNIAEHLKLPEGTLHSWIHDFGHLRKRNRDPEMMKLLPVNLRLESATSSAEWKKLLREDATYGDATPVVVVCGAYHGKSETGSLAAVVFDELKCNPCDGRLYAFCSLGGQQISTIQFMNKAFVFTRRPKCSGRYIWPNASVGTKIEVRKNEFDHLLELNKKRGTKPYFT